MKIRQTGSDRIFDFVSKLLLVGIFVIVAYPLYFILIASISDYNAVNSGKVILFPVGVTADCYKTLLADEKIWHGYFNTILYTLTGTILNVIVTLMAGYALSRKELPGRNVLMLFFMFTMFFNGGLIPLFIQINKMGLYNNPLVLVLLGTVSVYNLIITRTYFAGSVSAELIEAAQIDGCGTAKTFFRIVLPTSKAIIAVLVVYYAIFHWNGYFDALIYISDYKFQPLQIILRDILINSKMLDATMDIESLIERQKYAELVKYGAIVVSSLPMMIVYPFVQKYFEKGVMIGAVKE